MFAVIYRAYIKSGREADYKIFWHKIACYFVEQRGALGSCLHQAEDGLWLAYSRWPDKATRDASCFVKAIFNGKNRSSKGSYFTFLLSSLLM